MAREAEPRNGRRWEGIGDRVQAITEAVHESRYTGNVFRSLWSASQPKKKTVVTKAVDKVHHGPHANNQTDIQAG